MLKIALQQRADRRLKLEGTYNLNPKICPNCQSPLSFEKRRQVCCSRTCAAQHTGKTATKNIACVVCSKLVRRHKRTNTLCCSYTCSNTYKYIKYIEAWKNGERSGAAGEGVSSHVRRYLIEQRGEKCEICGWAEQHPVTNKVPVQVEHVDGDYTNNSEHNLKLLCPNHHSLTPTYGGLNRGRGRHARRQRRSTK